jgi:hypothetical protein
MEKVPSLFRRITAGMEGKMRHASSESRRGVTMSTIFSASSSMKMSEPMKMFAVLEVLLQHRLVGLRVPELLQQVAGHVSTAHRVVGVGVQLSAPPRRATDWYCASSTSVHHLDDDAPLGVGHDLWRVAGVDGGVALAAALVRNDHVLLGHVAGGHGALGTGRDVGDLKKGVKGQRARSRAFTLKKVRAHRHVTPERTARGGPDAGSVRYPVWILRPTASIALT